MQTIFFLSFYSRVWNKHTGYVCKFWEFFKTGNVSLVLALSLFHGIHIWCDLLSLLFTGLLPLVFYSVLSDGIRRSSKKFIETLIIYTCIWLVLLVVITLSLYFYVMEDDLLQICSSTLLL